MPRLTVDQRVWVCDEMARTRNAEEVVRLWHRNWPGIPAPAAWTIKRNFKKFEKHGPCLNRNRGNSGRVRTARAQESMERVLEELLESGV